MSEVGPQALDQPTTKAEKPYSALTAVGPWRLWAVGVGAGFALAIAAQVVTGAMWWVANLNTIPAYGDTSEYLGLARTLRVDAYRTVLYPLVLRTTHAAAVRLHLAFPFLLYLLQTAAAVAAIYYLVSTLWRVTATIGWLRLSAVGPRQRRLVQAAATLTLLTTPLIAHFSTTILSDSLALSLLVAAVAGVIRIAVLGDESVGLLVVNLFLITGAELMRPEKIYVVAPLLGAIVLVLAIKKRKPLLRLLASLACLTLLPVVAVSAVNLATQTANYGRPPLSLSTTLFGWTVWPRLAEIRPVLPADVRNAVSEADANAFDNSVNSAGPIIVQLRAAGGGTDRLVNETTVAALKCCWPAIGLRTAINFMKSSVAPITFPVEWYSGVQTPTAWTSSRMAQAHPLLTRIYLWVALIVLGLVELPLLGVLLVRAVSQHPPGVPRRAATAVVAIIAGLVTLNAGLFATSSGQDANIRYALPSYLLLGACLLWADLVAASSLLLPDRSISSHGRDQGVERKHS